MYTKKAHKAEDNPIWCLVFNFLIKCLTLAFPLKAEIFYPISKKK